MTILDGIARCLRDDDVPLAQRLAQQALVSIEYSSQMETFNHLCGLMAAKVGVFDIWISDAQDPKELISILKALAEELGIEVDLPG